MSTHSDPNANKYLSFSLGEVSYVIPIQNVTEIIGMQRISEVPASNRALRGVINLRGRVIPVMDVRLRFGMPELEYTDRTCIIVIQVGITSVGLVVDTVSDVMDLTEPLEPASALGENSADSCVAGFGRAGGEIRVVLEPQRLVEGLGVQSANLGV
ncbi:MAG: chemotaxis protein CheW [Myxococcales bacterium]|nr:chemotaxis protein CheW [Myxococcales bacterium]